jgi:hypothetical protein
MFVHYFVFKYAKLNKEKRIKLFTLQFVAPFEVISQKERKVEWPSCRKQQLYILM